MEHVIERVLTTVRQQLERTYTLDDLAAIAMFSKFHFARMFRQVTGVSPRRFLYALRLQEAKRLLVTTSLSVAEISHRVGYNSVGTFTTRFTASVGEPPAVYRRLKGEVISALVGESPDMAHNGGIIGRLMVDPEASGSGQIVVGLFRHPIPEGRPARCVVLAGPGVCAFRHVPPGRWYIAAVMAPGCGQAPVPDEDRLRMIGSAGPVRVPTGSLPVSVTLQLRASRPVDPPVLAPLEAMLRQRHLSVSGERPRLGAADHRAKGNLRPHARAVASEP